MLSRKEAYEVVDSELDYQNRTWPDDDLAPLSVDNDPNPLTPGEFLSLLRTYLRQAEDTWARERKPNDDTMEGIRKIAGISVNAIIQHGARKRTW